MAVRVAINGFGRIGRLAFRQMFGAEGYEVVAINDLTSPDMLAHLLKYDTAQGPYAGHTVEAGEGSITVDGKVITIYKEADASKLPCISRAAVRNAFSADCSRFKVLSSSPNSAIRLPVACMMVSLLSVLMLTPSENQSPFKAITAKNRVFPMP